VEKEDVRVLEEAIIALEFLYSKTYLSLPLKFMVLSLMQLSRLSNMRAFGIY
jgi:hypothetical protein